MNVHFSSKTNEWATPQALFDDLNEEFKFTLDPCATNKNKKVAYYFTSRDDGLKQDWGKHTVFMNPPYGREIGKWVKKASEARGKIVCLLPARTDTRWFWDNICDNPRAKIRFIKGRLKFGGHKNSAPFPSMIVIFN